MPKSDLKSSTTYVAFLLGINIGPHKRVAMRELKKMCEGMGFQNVRTLLASGNVVFDTEKKSSSELSSELEKQLRKTFGFEVGVIVRPMADIKKMIHANPFKQVPVTPSTRLYVTFFSEQPKEKLSTPHESSDKGGAYCILKISNGAIYGVLNLEKSGTTKAMDFLGKIFGKKITTRNWNTINKLV